ncbi:MBL fold metallo-hydrolase [Sinomonas susongensis]|uniref:MBL fold metallo-hydrolase n=1 Tax=Sinomonas susongensis TaxID=1324851 RepID=UPI001FEA1DED|nr:MBL fold metallo-hydrolase [Sinomonas susongensis]
MPSWRDLGGGTYSLSLEPLRLNIGLVVGAERALVVDTGEGPRQARLILEAVREKTELPLVVVNTHAHYDHYFGNALFAAAGVTEFWAHENAAVAMAAHGEEARAEVARTEAGQREPEMAEGHGDHTEIVVPQAIVRDQPVLVDLGGQSVTLFYLGRGHTDGDLLVGTSTTLFTGDLVEEGSYPEFEDAYPEEWADSLRHISALRHRYEHLVPGHGGLSTDVAVRTMAETMATAVRSARQATRETPHDATKAIPILPYGPEQSRLFISRLKAASSLH